MPPPRLCIIHRRPDFQGYGFNLHAEKGKTGQFIGVVDEDSPALDAGLKEGDRIVEVNGINVMEDTHHEVVSKIKAKPNTVGLLVIDKAGEQYYKDRGLTVHGDMPNIIQCETSLHSHNEPEPEVQPTIVAAVHTQPGKILFYSYKVI